jgi:hypothetical protein
MVIMSLITKITDVTFTDSTLPKLYRDSVINPSTLFLYDAINPVSYPKQAQPANGTPSADLWVDLVDLSADGLIYPDSGNMTWANGFVSAIGPGDKIVLHNGANPATPTKFLGVVWFKMGAAQTDGDVSQIVANFAGMAFLQHATAATTNVVDNRLYVAGNFMGNSQITAISDTSGLAGNIFQIGISYDNSTLTGKVFVNGALSNTFPGYQIIQAPSGGFNLMYRSGVQTDFKGTFYRCLYDTLGTKTPEEIIAADWAANNGRFS